MSGLIPNSTTLYLRPIENIPPYQVNNCAIWLYHNKTYNNRKFRSAYEAKMWLINTEEQNPYLYKAIFAEFYDNTQYQASVLSGRNVNKYHTSTYNSYGDEPHMWF
jgi:hypothetical protein